MKIMLQTKLNFSLTDSMKNFWRGGPRGRALRRKRRTKGASTGRAWLILYVIGMFTARKLTWKKHCKGYFEHFFMPNIYPRLTQMYWFMPEWTWRNGVQGSWGARGFIITCSTSLTSLQPARGQAGQPIPPHHFFFLHHIFGLELAFTPAYIYFFWLRHSFWFYIRSVIERSASEECEAGVGRVCLLCNQRKRTTYWICFPNIRLRWHLTYTHAHTHTHTHTLTRAG